MYSMLIAFINLTNTIVIHAYAITQFVVIVNTHKTTLFVKTSVYKMFHEMFSTFFLE